MKGKLLLAALLLALSVLTGCNKGPKPDVTVFMMTTNGVSNEVGDKLHQSMQAKLGEAPTTQVITTPLFSMEKLIVELAAGDHGVIIIPAEQFKVIGQQGGYVSLDDVAKPEDFSEGVLEITENGKTEKHLYGIPLEKSKWFTELALNGKGLFAFIPVNAPDQAKAKQVMKVIAEKN